MKIQLYHLKSKDPETRNLDIDDIIGGPVYSSDDSDDIIGFIFSYKRDNDTFGICLFEPKEFEDDFINEMLYYEEEVDYETYFKIIIENNPEHIDFWKDVLT